MELAELEVKYKEMGEAIERLKAPKVRWKPVDGNRFHYIEENGYIDSMEFESDRYDDGCVAMGNCYKTEEEAQYEVNRRKAIVEVNDIIEELNDGWEPDWNNFKESKHLLSYRYRDENIFSYDCKQGSPASELLFSRNNCDEEIKERITKEKIKLIWRL